MAQVHFNTSIAVRSEFCSESRADSCGLVIFGASGDLTHRKLLPALFQLFLRSLLPEQFYIVGFARTKMTDEAFRQKSQKSLKDRFNDVSDTKIDNFIKDVQGRLEPEEAGIVARGEDGLAVERIVAEIMK